MLRARFGWFVVGTVAFYLMRPGIVPWWEAVQRGVLVSLVAFLVETTGKLVSRAHLRWFVQLAFVPLLLFAIPLVAALHPLHTVPKRSPAAFGLAFEDIRFGTADGLTLAGWVIPAEKERGNVIFCHGHGRNRGHVAGLLPTLHDLGLNVLAFDFRGHGDSDGHASTFGYREVTDLVAAEAYLRQRFPDKPLFLVGVSLGAAVSLQALPFLPDVRGVWSEGSFARFSDVAAHEFCWVRDGLRTSLMQLYYCAGWLDTGFWGPSANPVECVTGASVPVYFCHAVKDELVPLTQGQALFDAHAGPKWSWWVADATHYDVRQRHREEYLLRLRSFLDDLMSQQTTLLSAKCPSADDNTLTLQPQATSTIRCRPATP